MKEIINNAAAILEECLYNGSIGDVNLCMWFTGERPRIESILNDLITFIKIEEEKENAKKIREKDV